MDVHDRYQKALRDRERIQGEVDRFRGRLEQALEAVRSLEQECRSRNIEPGQLDAVVAALEVRYESAVRDLERQVQEARQKLAPYMGEKF